MKMIRGAITVETDTPESIRDAILELFDALIRKNGVPLEDLQSILITATRDIRSAYPGRFLREERGLKDVALLHFQEMDVEGALPMCIRVLVQCEGTGFVHPIYLRKATALRLDLQ